MARQTELRHDDPRGYLARAANGDADGHFPGLDLDTASETGDEVDEREQDKHRIPRHRLQPPRHVWLAKTSIDNFLLRDDILFVQSESTHEAERGKDRWN